MGSSGDLKVGSSRAGHIFRAVKRTEDDMGTKPGHLLKHTKSNTIVLAGLSGSGKTVLFHQNVEGKLNDETVSSSKAVEQETPKAPVTESEQKTEDAKIPQPAPVTESEQKPEDAEIPHPAIAEVKKVDGAPVLDVPAAVIEDTDPKPDVSSVSEPVVKDVEETKGVSDVLEPAIESVEKPLDSLPSQEPGSEVETKLVVPEESERVEKSESVGEEPKIEKEPKFEESEESKIVEKPDSVLEKPVVEEEPVVLQSVVKEVEKSESALEEPEVGKQLEISESDSKVEKPEPAVQVEEKPQELPEDVVEIEEKLEPKESTEGELLKEEAVLVNKVEEITESLPEKVTVKDEEPVASESSVTIIRETLSVPVEVVSVVPDVSDSADAANAQKEESVSDVIEESTKEASLEESKAEEKVLEESVKEEGSAEPESTTTEEKKDEIKDVVAAPVETTEDTEPLITKTEEVGNSSSAIDIAPKPFEGQITPKDVEVVTEEKKEEGANNDTVSTEISKDTEPQSTKTEVGDDSNSAVVIAEKSFEGEPSSKDVVVVAEEKKEEDVKDDTISPVEAAKATDEEEKVNVDATVDTTNETVAEPKELELEPKAKDIAEATMVEKAAEVAEEASKANDDSKPTDDPSKPEVPTKPKQSNSIISKVKQSIVKVKKAIIGKSPSSKSMPSDAKEGHIKVK